MNWQDDLIDSVASAHAFLRRELKAMHLPNLAFKPFTARDDAGLLLFVATFLEKSQPAVALFLQAKTAENTSLTIYNCQVAASLRGRQLGLKACKAALGIGHLHAVRQLRLTVVTDDGPSFWPTLGARMQKPPAGLAASLEDSLALHSKNLDVEDVEELQRVAQLAKQCPASGWQALAMCKVKLADGYFFKTPIFQQLCGGDELYIDLEDQAIQALLTRRLGRLPVFPASRPIKREFISQGWCANA